jgi:hypothetical protein
MTVSTALANWLDPCFDLAWVGLQEFQWERESRPEDFRRFRYQTKKGDFLLVSDGWLESQGLLNLRWTRLRAASLDIATLMCYPTNRPDIFPVFAFEWVLVGGQGHAMVCDVEVCGDQPDLERRLQPVFEEISERYGKIFTPRERPGWFEDIAQPHAQLFTASVDDLPTVFELQKEYLALTVESFYRSDLTSGVKGGPDHPDVLAYKHHHAENSPGGRMLQKWFGAEKAHDFLYNYHFGPGGV